MTDPVVQAPDGTCHGVRADSNGAIIRTRCGMEVGEDWVVMKTEITCEDCEEGDE